MIRTNEGTVDRWIRAVLGVAVILSASVGGALGVFMTVAGLVVIATALAGWCPLYALVGLDTRHSSS